MTLDTTPFSCNEVTASVGRGGYSNICAIPKTGFYTGEFRAAYLHSILNSVAAGFNLVGELSNAGALVFKNQHLTGLGLGMGVIESIISMSSNAQQTEVIRTLMRGAVAECRYLYADPEYNMEGCTANVPILASKSVTCAGAVDFSVVTISESNISPHHKVITNGARYVKPPGTDYYTYGTCGRQFGETIAIVNNENPTAAWRKIVCEGGNSDQCHPPHDDRVIRYQGRTGAHDVSLITSTTIHTDRGDDRCEVKMVLPGQATPTERGCTVVRVPSDSGLSATVTVDCDVHIPAGSSLRLVINGSGCGTMPFYGEGGWFHTYFSMINHLASLVSHDHGIELQTSYTEMCGVI